MKGLVGFIVLLLVLIGLNSFTIVNDGEEKVGRLLGEIQAEVYTAGLHIVNPMMDFDTYNIKEKLATVDNIGIPSQDKFTSTSDISVKWGIKPGYAPKLARTIGTERDIEQMLISEPLQSFVREAGRSVPLAQDLFTSAIQESIQNSIYTDLKTNAEPYGITVYAVYLKDIQLPPVIRSAIDTTKRLEEEVAQENANLQKQKLVYQREVESARAAAESAKATEQQRQALANAAAYERRTAADANLYAAQKESEANITLGKSVTKELMNLKNLEVEMQKAVSWKGGVPQTIMGESGGVVPLYHLNSSK